ncbi:unnamed protein product, partial [Ceratitis capitata]
SNNDSDSVSDNEAPSVELVDVGGTNSLPPHWSDQFALANRYVQVVVGSIQRHKIVRSFEYITMLQQNRQILRQLKLLKQTVIFECTPPVAEALKQQLQRQKKQHQYLRNNKREHSLLKTRQNSLQLKHSKLACVELTDLLLLCCNQLLTIIKCSTTTTTTSASTHNNNSCSGVESKAKDDDAVPTEGLTFALLAGPMGQAA